MRRDKVIAIDFEGTIYNSKSSKLVDGAASAIEQLHGSGYTLVLWTCRTGNRLKNAINILKKYNLLQYFEYINETPAFIPYKISCKVCAEWYIDDRNIGGFIGWDNVIKILIGSGYSD